MMDGKDSAIVDENSSWMVYLSQKEEWKCLIDTIFLSFPENLSFLGYCVNGGFSFEDIEELDNLGLHSQQESFSRYVAQTRKNLSTEQKEKLKLEHMKNKEILGSKDYLFFSRGGRDPGPKNPKS